MSKQNIMFCLLTKAALLIMQNAKTFFTILWICLKVKLINRGVKAKSFSDPELSLISIFCGIKRQEYFALLAMDGTAGSGTHLPSSELWKEELPLGERMSHKDSNFGKAGD